MPDPSDSAVGLQLGVEIKNGKLDEDESDQKAADQSKPKPKEPEYNTPEQNNDSNNPINEDPDAHGGVEKEDTSTDAGNGVTETESEHAGEELDLPDFVDQSDDDQEDGHDHKGKLKSGKSDSEDPDYE